MVLTRRAAKAAAEAEAEAVAEAAAEAAAETAAEAVANAKAQAAAEATVIAHAERHLAKEDVATLSRLPLHAQPLQDTPWDASDAANTSANVDANAHLRLGLYFGHACAMVAVAAAVHAASGGPSQAYPIHALVVLACIVPVRTMLAMHVAFASRLSLGLTAAVLFSSNALHVLASRVDVPHIRLYLVAAALQVSAAWLDMSVATLSANVLPPLAYHPLSRVSFIRSFLDNASDIFLAAIVSKQDQFVGLFILFFWFRMLVDLICIIASSLALFRRDEHKNATDVQSAKQQSFS